MGRFLSDGHRFLRKGARFVGQGQPLAVPLADTFPPRDFEGSVAYGADGQLKYSDGNIWRVPSDTTPVARPVALPPTTSQEQTQLRLTEFFSPAGLSQTGVYFEVAMSETGFEAPLFTRTILSASANTYQTIFPEDGIAPGQVFYWRALYTATQGQQSDFSLPFKQTYPELIDRPDPVTRDGATSGAVELSAYNSTFGLNYVETRIEVWETDQDPDLDPPLATFGAIEGPSVFLPDSLADGQAYLWRGRYGGRAGAAGAVIVSDWSPIRTVLNGAASMLLVFDPDRAQSRTVSLPLGVHGGIVDVSVDWGDGALQTVQSGGIVSHAYDAGVTGLVTVTVSGQLEQFGGNANIQGLIRVDNIGFKLGLTSLREMFRNCTTNTVYVNPAIPPQVSNVQGMCRNAEIAFDVSALVLSAVENMSDMFRDATAFNQPLAPLATGSATTMAGMFHNAHAFNQPIGTWDVSNVTTMKGMFTRADAFNRDIGTWDVSRVTDMTDMFHQAYAFNRDIGAWDVGRVTDMSGMFQDASAFNQGIGNWTMSGVTSTARMFRGADAFNRAIGGWDMSAVLNMRDMFMSAISFNQAIGGWDVGQVTDMGRMFFRAFAFNQNLGGWNPGNVTSTEWMFYNATAFNQDLSGWDVAKVSVMGRMFNRAFSFNQPIGDWTVSSITDVSHMFEQASEFNQDLGGWGLPASGVINLDAMFENTPALSTETYARTLIGWANRAVVNDGPFGQAFAPGAKTYDAIDHVSGERFLNAVDARAFLARSRRALVAGASIADADGDFLWNGAMQQFEKSNGWHFFDTGTAWELRDGTDAVQATAQDTTMPDQPYKVATWDGVLSAASVALNGMGWTITDGGLV